MRIPVLSGVCLCAAVSQAVLEASASCLPRAVPEEKRRSLPSGQPVGLWLLEWDSAQLVTHVAKVLISEALGYRTVISGSSAGSLSASLAVAGCTQDESGIKCPDGPVPENHPHHAALEIWSSQRSVHDIGQQNPQLVPNIVYIGYDGMEGIYVPGAQERRARKEFGIRLTDYNFLDVRWFAPWRFFSSHQRINVNRLMPCVNTDFAMPAYLESTRRFTPDPGGFDDKGRAICSDGYWWLSPACRANASTCVPWITGGRGWFLAQAMQRAIEYNSPLAIAIGANYSQYVSLPLDTDVLCYTWQPSMHFLSNDPEILKFPPVDLAAHAAGDYRTATEIMPLMTWIGKTLEVSAPKVQAFLSTMNFAVPDVKSLMHFVQSTGDYMAAACAWLQNTTMWQSWLPNEKKCFKGWGLVNDQGAFVEDLVSAVTCAPCTSGRFSQAQDWPQMATRVCKRCEAGSAQPMWGADACDACGRGYYQSSTGQLACERCPRATFSNTTRSEACTVCPFGKTTDGTGVTSEALCGCTAGSFRPAQDLEHDRCEPCPEGMWCDWGSDWRNLGTDLGSYPLTKPGYMTLASNPLRVFACKVPASCPGGAPASCALLRDNASVACGECLRGSSDIGSPDGSCLPCTRGAAAPAVVVLILGSVVVITAVRMTQSSQLHEKSQVVVLGLLLSQLVSAVQALGIFGNLDVDWDRPLSDILHAFSVLMLDISVLRAGCILGQSPILVYLSRHVVLPVCVLLVFVGLAWKKRSIPDINLRIELCTSIGSVMNIVFISIVIACVAPLWCTIEHPCGAKSMLASPSTLCWEDPQHVIMVVVGVLAFAVGPFIFISTYAWILYRCSAVVKNINATAQNLRQLQAARFVFVRFKPSAAWYGLMLLLRNLLIALVPVVMVDSATQLSAVFTLVMVLAVIQQRVKPWRLAVVNIVDTVASNLFLLILLAGSAGTARTTSPTRGSRFAVWLGFVSCILLLSTIILPVAISVQSITRRKMYSHFICYHKEEAAGQARYLKLLLGNRRGTEVFIDADNLANLGSTFEIVRNHVRCVIVYMTSQTLTRPWCAGEIVSAFAVDLLVVGVRTHSFIMPPEPSDLTALENFLDLRSCSLTEYGIILPMIADAYQTLLTGPDSRLIIMRSPGRRKRMLRFQDVAEDLIVRTGQTYRPSVGILPSFKRGSPVAPPAQPDFPTSSVYSPVVLCSDDRDDEAAAVSGVLAAKLSSIVVEGIVVLADHDQDEDFIAGMVEVARALIVILSACSLTSMPQMQAITRAMSMVAPRPVNTFGATQASTSIPQVLAVIPLSLPGFAPPWDTWFTETLPRVWAKVDPYARHALRNFFMLILIRFQTFGSDAFLQAQAEQIAKRVPATWEPRPTSTVNWLHQADMASGSADVTVRDGTNDPQVPVTLQAAKMSPRQLESL